MRSTQETYHEVAQRCSEYDCKHCRDRFTDLAGDSVSCLTCTHFADDEHCRLDLYDPIVRNL
ncbi:MAG: hypothetical protein IJV15_07250 [Lachnospiraceae bacterium]|nr:hypothetical protein [Lachnospiraceae bacterium]MBQ9609221.1 hypothetical protein [Lachnospiraceae bacterium]